ncbi:2OG-Fe(II) oxygenase [Gallaecimonas mangrovi]|uniref:2OG-Fe(II) oxygenase n=1 Tax=Gallaecimonas mangrovi TaxID=2291597 RepID=UPI000E2017EB|nr:2OG-Fe(II) oxygenase [Gallaecimonas mangrovi]
MQFIEVIDDALPDSLCQQLLERFAQDPAVAAGRTGGGVDTSKKRSRDVTLDSHPQWQDLKQAILSETFPHICRYLDKHFMLLMGAVSPVVRHPTTGEATTLTPENYLEVGRPNLGALVQHFYRSGHINMQHYQCKTGGYPHWHSEVFPQLPHNEPLHRVLLWMYYLNDVAEGGETEFFYQRHRVKPKKGRLVIAPASFTHTHRGNAPLSGDKYIITSWVMFNRAEQLYGDKKGA